MRDARRRTAALGAGPPAVLSGLLGLLLVLTGCGEDEPAGDPPDFSESEPPALWNPCDALDAALVERAFGTVAEEQSGTPADPECRFAPDEKTGQPVVEANYVLFPGGLEAAWDTMGQPADAEVAEPDVPRADAARIVSDVVKKQLYVTGFVQNGDLIQTVNVVDPAPYDEERVVAGVDSVLAVLSRHAAGSGLTASPTSSTDNPH